MPGDAVAAISLSWGGAAEFPHRYHAGKQQLEEMFQVRVVETRHALRDADWLAKHPEARADDLMGAFADPEIRGVVSIIGGDDSIRILPHLDLRVIRDNPKVFMGYSDTTVSHLACLKAGVVSFYGPAVMAGFAENGGMLSYTVDSLRSTVFSAEQIGQIHPNSAGWTDERLDWGNAELQTQPRRLRPTTGWRWLQGEGKVTGPLIGGCIEVLDWLRGSSVWPDHSTWQDAVLFIETSEDKPTPAYLAGVLRTLASLGVLERLGAILFGRPFGSMAASESEAYDRALCQVVTEEYGLAHTPIITNMDFGHTDPMMVWPYGLSAQVDCQRRTISILDNAVSER